MSYESILACLTAVASGARSIPDVATRCGWTIAQAGAALLAAERGGYMPTDSDGALRFELTPASALLVDMAVAEQEQARQWQPVPAAGRAFLSQFGGNK